MLLLDKQRLHFARDHLFQLHERRSQLGPLGFVRGLALEPIDGSARHLARELAVKQLGHLRRDRNRLLRHKLRARDPNSGKHSFQQRHNRHSGEVLGTGRVLLKIPAAIFDGRASTTAELSKF